MLTYKYILMDTNKCKEYLDKQFYLEYQDDDSKLIHYTLIYYDQKRYYLGVIKITDIYGRKVRVPRKFDKLNSGSYSVGMDTEYYQSCIDLQKKIGINPIDGIKDKCYELNLFDEEIISLSHHNANSFMYLIDDCFGMVRQNGNGYE